MEPHCLEAKQNNARRRQSAPVAGHPAWPARLPAAPRAAGRVPRFRRERARALARPLGRAAAHRGQPGRHAGSPRARRFPRALDHGGRRRYARVARPRRAPPRRRPPYQRAVADARRPHAARAPQAPRRGARAARRRAPERCGAQAAALPAGKAFGMKKGAGAPYPTPRKCRSRFGRPPPRARWCPGLRARLPRSPASQWSGRLFCRR